jgi:hypothetical protein
MMADWAWIISKEYLELSGSHHVFIPFCIYWLFVVSLERSTVSNYQSRHTETIWSWSEADGMHIVSSRLGSISGNKHWWRDKSVNWKDTKGWISYSFSFLPTFPRYLWPRGSNGGDARSEWAKPGTCMHQVMLPTNYNRFWKTHLIWSLSRQSGGDGIMDYTWICEIWEQNPRSE